MPIDHSALQVATKALADDQTMHSKVREAAELLAQADDEKRWDWLRTLEAAPHYLSWNPREFQDHLSAIRRAMGQYIPLPSPTPVVDDLKMTAPDDSRR